MHVASNDEYKHRFVYADAFRAIAIFGVVLTHYISDVHVRGKQYHIGSFGAIFVNIFFLLSGYLLSRPFLLAIYERTSFPNIPAFFQRRFLRIYPAYAVAVLISMIGVSQDKKPALPFFLSHITFLHGFIYSQILARNVPLWTMAVDVQFYLILPFLAYGLYRITASYPKQKREASLFIALVSAVAISILWRLLMSRTLPNLGMYNTSYNMYMVILRNIIGVGTGFALGGIIAMLELKAVKIRNVRTRNLILLTGFALLFLSMVHALWLTPIAINEVIDDLLPALSVSLIFFEISHGHSPTLNRLVHSPLIRKAAEYSYSIYLIHWMCLWWAVGTIMPALHLTRKFEGLAIGLVMTAVLSYALNTLVERPFLRMKAKVSRTERTSPIETVRSESIEVENDLIGCNRL